jgi:hypothetical protein
MLVIRSFEEKKILAMITVMIVMMITERVTAAPLASCDRS